MDQPIENGDPQWYLDESKEPKTKTNKIDSELETVMCKPDNN